MHRGFDAELGRSDAEVDRYGSSAARSRRFVAAGPA